ncbi:MAG: L-type lectin-domain containing protein [Microcoleaceae cyanobacterium]
MTIQFKQMLPITLKKLSITTASAAITALTVISGANAASIDFRDFSDTTGWSLNNSAKVVNNSVLRLTDNLEQSGSAFTTDTISLSNNASFSSAFQFQITNPLGDSDDDGQGADGVVFAIQAESNSAGSDGGGIGYAGILNSLGIEFDTWNNGDYDGNNGNHVGINLDGYMISKVSKNVPTRFNNGDIWSVWVDYNGATDLLEVRFSENNERPEDADLSSTVDLINILGQTDAYIGFTSGTGAAGGTHDILNLQFDDSFNPIGVEPVEPEDVPEPTTILGLLAFGGIGASS